MELTGMENGPLPFPPHRTSPLLKVLRGEPAEFVPVAPIYSRIATGPAAGFARAARARLWRERLDAAQADYLGLAFDDYLAVELAVHEAAIETCYPPPCWHPTLLLEPRSTVEGSLIRRWNDSLSWVTQAGETLLEEPSSPPQPGPARSISVWNRVEKCRRELDETPAICFPDHESAQSLLDSGRFALIQALRQRYGEALPFAVACASPFWACYGALGFVGMMVSMVEAPGLVHRACQRATPRREPYWEALRAVGVEIAFVEESLTGADMISPDLYRRFVWPYARRTLRFLERQGFRTVYYVCGNVMPLLGEIAELPFTAFALEEDKKEYGLDLAEVRRRLGDDRVLFGNVDALLIERAADEVLIAEVRRQIEVAGRRGGFVLSNGSPFTPATSLERIRFFVESTQRLG
jgi:hypothetical protein